MPPLYRPDVQSLSRDDLRALQEERLRALVQRMFAQPVPFFRARLESAGLGPDDIKTLDDLRRVPRTTKQDLRESEQAHPPLGSYRGAPVSASVRLSASTGTTGRPTVIMFTAHDLAVEHEAAARMFARQGYKPGEIIAHAHPGGLNGGAALLGGCIEAYGCLNIAVGPPASRADAERAIRLWQDLKPDHFELFGPVLHTFWDTAVSMGLDPARDCNLPALVDMPPYRTMSAGLECFAFLGSACEQNSGAHVCEDEAIVEALDPVSGEPVPDGARGTLVVTALTKDNALLRYDLQDVVRLDRAPCPCGETHLRAFWEGRYADIVRAAGREFLPNDVWNALNDIAEVSTPALEFQMVRSASTDALRVRVEATTPSAALETLVCARLHERLGVPVTLELLAAGALPRPAYKPARVVDE